MDEKRFLDKFKYKPKELSDRSALAYSGGICNPDCEHSSQGCNSCQSSCQSYCQRHCQTSCQRSCQSSCEKHCQSSCEKSCQNCLGACEKACEKHCMNACEHGCQTSCEKSCEKACEKNCMTQCEMECQEQCELNCENCEGECMVGCEVGCEEPCEKNCLEACEIGCQNCEGKCECSNQACDGGCQCECENGCLGCMEPCEIPCQCLREQNEPPCGEGSCVNCEGNCECANQICDGGCQGECEDGCLGCMGVCEITCQCSREQNEPPCGEGSCVNCEGNCECSNQVCNGGCQDKCMEPCLTVCQSSCELPCEKNCQEVCELSCQDACEENCQAGDQTPCGEGTGGDTGDIPETPTNIKVNVKGNKATITFTKGKNAYITRVAKEWENTFIETTGTRVIFSDLEYDKEYITAFQSVSKDGKLGEWTEAITFRTDKEDTGDIPQPPTNINIDVIGNEATITFTKGKNAYKTRVAKEWENTFIETAGTRVVFSELEYDKEYITAFQSVSEDGKLGKWTEARTFRTEKENSLELPSNINAKVTGSHVTITFTKGQNAYKTAISGDMTTVEKLVPVEGEVFEFNLPKDSIHEMYKKEYTFTLQSIAEDGKKSALTRSYHFENDVKFYLKFGDENYKVRIVQKNLNLIKYYPDKINGKGSIDGKYYDETKKAVKKVQQYIKEKVDSKIVVDGIVYIGIIKHIEDLLVKNNQAFRTGIMNNEKLKELQEKLYAFGYYKLAHDSLETDIDGDFGTNTFDAVKDFQEKDTDFEYYFAYYKETSSLGFADPITIDKINEKYKRISGYLSKNEIVEMQTKLNLLRFTCDVNGICDERTRKCIKYFQLKYRLKTSNYLGIVDKETFDAVCLAYEEKIRELQNWLKELKYTLNITGKYDEDTKNAILDFQQKYMKRNDNLGILDVETLDNVYSEYSKIATKEIYSIYVDNKYYGFDDAAKYISAMSMGYIFVDDSIKDNITKATEYISNNGRLYDTQKQSIDNIIKDYEKQYKMYHKIWQWKPQLQENAKAYCSTIVAGCILQGKIQWCQRIYKAQDKIREIFNLDHYTGNYLRKMCIKILKFGLENCEIEEVKANMVIAAEKIKNEESLRELEIKNIESLVKDYEKAEKNENRCRKIIISINLSNVLSDTLYNKTRYEIYERGIKAINGGLQFASGVGEIITAVPMVQTGLKLKGLDGFIIPVGGVCLGADGGANALEGASGIWNGLIYNKGPKEELNFVRGMFIDISPDYGEDFYNEVKLVAAIYSISKTAFNGLDDFSNLTNKDLKFKTKALDGKCVQVKRHKNNVNKYSGYSDHYKLKQTFSVNKKQFVIKEVWERVGNVAELPEELTLRIITIDKKYLGDALKGLGLDIKTVYDDENN